VPNRYTAVFRFDAPDLEDARGYARGLRLGYRNRNRHEWERRNARLLRIKSPENYVSGTARFEAEIKFDAPDLSDAQTFARDVRRMARAGVPVPRRRRTPYGFQQWTARDATLLRVVNPAAVIAQTDEELAEPAQTTAEVAADQTEA